MDLQRRFRHRKCENVDILYINKLLIIFYCINIIFIIILSEAGPNQISESFKKLSPKKGACATLNSNIYYVPTYMRLEEIFL